MELKIALAKRITSSEFEYNIMQMSIEAGFTMYVFLCRHSKCVCVVIQLDKAMLFVPEATVCVTTISSHGLCFWTK